MHPVHGVAQHYSWGDLTTIPDLLGQEPDGRPCAELWFGTHHGGPSTLEGGELLEARVGPLPYLLKVLAAAEPLSLQVHPSTEQAVAGFRRENALKIPLDAPQRTYRDERHKPELLYALSPFQAVCGVAPAGSTHTLLAALGPAANTLRRKFDEGGVKAVVAYLLREGPALGPLLDAAAHHDEPHCRWLNRLSQLHPGDASAALVLFLNYVAMEPGEAIYLGAGNLHAYLGGTGIEIMANSDNVVRCGLTSKHVDAEEVLRVLDPTPLVDPLVKPTPTLDGGHNYPVPVNDFRITAYDIDGSVGWQAEGPELLLCTSGESVGIAKGQCMLAENGEEVELIGTATVFRVGVG